MTQPLNAIENSEVLHWAQMQKVHDDPQNTSQETRRKGFKEMSGLFMSLLQNANSNPLSGGDPAEGTRLIQSMMEAYSRLEQEDHLRAMRDELRQNNLLQSAHLVGQRGTFENSSFQLGGVPDDVHIEIPEGKGETNVHIDLFRASDGSKIGHLKDTFTSGTHTLNERLHSLKPGEYIIKAYGSSKKGEKVDVKTLITGTIDKILLKEGKIWALQGAHSVPLKQLRGLSLLAPLSTVPPSLSSVIPH
jgi:hypothetical protein